MPSSKSVARPTVLVVLDGWGISPETENNGVALAKTPNYDRLSQEYPMTTLEASGLAVGLPEGQIGNSEVGHMTIGAGSVLYQDLVRIDRDISTGDFALNPAFQQAIDHVRQTNGKVHLIGLISNGGVHSHERHLSATLELLAKADVPTVIHAILDGRDCPRDQGAASIAKLEQQIKSLGHGQIASLCGRYFAMDRDNNQERTALAWQAIAHHKAKKQLALTDDLHAALQAEYQTNCFDEMMPPIVVGEANATNLLEAGDAVIMTNFRPDRARQLAELINNEVTALNLCLVTMTDYGVAKQAIIAYQPKVVNTCLAAEISRAGLKQLHIAESEKYAHATYFLNGGRETEHAGETFKLIESRKDVKTHDEAPEMRAAEITEAALEGLEQYDFIFINYANPDMVGHTANQSAIITAIETVDRELGRLVEAVLSHQGQLMVIADHGNAEVMIDHQTGQPHTAHTTNQVPCIIINQIPKKLKTSGGLADVAPTVLELMGLPTSQEMSGQSLLLAG